MTLIGMPQKIEASAQLSETGVDEECLMTFSYAKNVKANLKSTLLEKTPTECTIEFEEATVKLTSRFHEPPSSIEITTQNAKKELIEFPVATLGYNYEATHVQEMLSENKTESTVMTFDKSLHLISLLDQVREKIGLEY